MNISLVIVAIVVAILIIALILLIAGIAGNRKQAKSAGKSYSRPARVEKSRTRWRAVKIAPGLICCDAAGELDEQVYLSSESPSLPLENCDRAECRCKYVHLEDRRRGGDRRVQLGELDNFLPFNQTERRRSPGRRTADLAA